MMSGIIFIYYSNDNIVIIQLLLSLLFYVDINFIDSFFTVVFFFTAFFNCYVTIIHFCQLSHNNVVPCNSPLTLFF